MKAWNPAIFGMIAAAAVAVVGCEEIPLNERYGQLLSPDDVEDCPEGCIPYVTATRDTLFMVAKWAYGDGYKLYRIINVAENQDTLETITQLDGTLERGHILFLPPDEKGNTIDPKRPRKYWYFRGRS